jgi:Ras-related protein Rab-11A
MEKSSHDYLFRIVMAGDSGVGKTNLLMRFTENNFNFETKTTIGAQFSQKSIQVENKNIECQIWDTAGQERFHAITCTYFRGAVGAALVYDVCSKSSFTSVERWLKNLKDLAEPEAVIILIGNKSDLENLRAVSVEEAQIFAQKNGIEFIETSALIGTNVSLAFESLARKIYFLKQEKLRNEAKGTRKESNYEQNHKVVLKHSGSKRKKCC